MLPLESRILFLLQIMPVTYHPGSALRDYLKPFLRIVPVWQSRRLLLLAKGLAQTGGSTLSEGCRAVRGGSVTSWVWKASSLLEKLPWATLCALHHARLRIRQKKWHLVVHDATALPKPWAEKMEGLSTVYDGCTGNLVTGYTCIMSIGVGEKAWDIHPIRCTLVNPAEKEYLSQNVVLQTHLRAINDAQIGHDLLHVFDCGFDDEKHFAFCDDALRVPWMIRLKEDRCVKFRGERHSVMLVGETLLAGRKPDREGVIIASATIGVLLPSLKPKKRGSPIPQRNYTLVAVKRPQFLTPMLLLLNAPMLTAQQAAQVYLEYLDRFEVEHYFRLWKQTCCPAQVQMMTAPRIQGLLHLQMLLLDFLLREHEKGRDPFGGGLWETLQERYVHKQETLILSPYVVAKAVRELLLEDRLRAPVHLRCSLSSPSSCQSSLFPPAELDTITC